MKQKLLGGPSGGLNRDFVHVEEKQVADIKNKVQTVRNLLEVTNGSIKQTQNIRGCVNGRRDERCFNDYRGDECQNHAHAETKSSPVGRVVTLVQQMARKRRRRIETNIEIVTNAPI